MTKETLKAYFPNRYAAKIKHKKIGCYAEMWAGIEPYFETWEQAYGHQLYQAELDCARTKKEAEAAARHLKRVMLMKIPKDKP